MKKIYFKIVLLALLFFPISSLWARENVTDWYIKRLDSQIVVNRDSSLNITEKILADCGTGLDKHGIFRILPEKITIDGKGVVRTPVDLISIKDENGNDYEFTESKNISDDTITWKIGSANKTVQGENTYIIKYTVKNAIRFYNDNFDELYWNLTGNFWELEIDSVRVEIILPEEVNKNNSTVDLYSGYLNEGEDKLADFKWMNSNMLEFNSTETLLAGQGITTAVTFPKNIFTPYKPTFLEVYGKYLFFIVPVLVFMFCFKIWKKYGDDPSFDRTVIAEYEAPENMSPTEMGLLMTNGTFKNHFVTAEIINFAVLGIITIKEIENKILFFTSKDYELIRTNKKEAEDKLNEVQKIILNKIFQKDGNIKVSSLKNEFYKVLGDLKKKGNELLGNKRLIGKSGIKYSLIFIPIGFILVFFGVFFILSVSGWLGLALLISGIIVVIFGFIMPKRTTEGAEMNWKIKGFKLFMEAVDKDRAKFYEEKNIFEKFLPYAILFEITDIWIKRIREIYGEEYFARHVPVWYVGSNMASFDADSFSSTLNSLSSSIAASTSSPSGSGGGGSSGGGGGGGGGGGW
ncbi:MAG: hypothetical protein ACD_7C00369G0004 [uncultured bacterium]|nr:MAG: hypothetical protein ACD_7C00369G0004 [uncultured bacterium]HBR79643.1 hypothetical protein [Candidatus Moranbacteria bacterium]